MEIDTSKAKDTSKNIGKSEKELLAENEEAIKKVVGANADQEASADVELEQGH